MKVLPHFNGIDAATQPITLRQLTVSVLAPALYALVFQKSANVAFAGVDGNRCTCKVYGNQRVTHLLRLIAPVLPSTATQLSNLVIAPALHNTGYQKSTGEIATGSNLEYVTACIDRW
jgi:hypothetical protein